MATAAGEPFGERAIEHCAPEPPADEPTPQGVLLGAGGDPQILGLPTFIVGSLALAFVTVGVVPATGIGVIIPVIALTTAVRQFISCLWAIFLGQSIVASIFGVFGGFWATLALFLIGLLHNWFLLGTPAAQVHARELFFISWDILFFFLLLITLRLPAVYPGIVLFVILAVICVILSLEAPGSATTLSDLAGIAIFIVAGLGVWAWLNVGSVALGGPAQPSLGPPIIR